MCKPVVLVADGRARCAVELAAEPSPAEQTAGEELVHYLRRLGGVPIDLHRGDKSEAPVRILVGARGREEGGGLPLSELRDDGFVLSVSPDRIVIVGANERGALYGAYEVIERLGVRWYWPGPENEFVPEVGDVALPAGTEVINPSFRFRHLLAIFLGMTALKRDPYAVRDWIHPFQAFPSPQKEHLLDWGVKNRLNVVRMESLEDEDTVAIFARRGGVAGLDSVHAWCSMAPQDVYYDAHPEYYAMDEAGNRFPKHPKAGQFCTSNPEAIDLVVRAALEAMERNPEAVFVSVTQADGIRHCHCPKCLAKCDQGTMGLRENEVLLVRTDYLMDYANRVAERFCEKWPDRYVYVLAYHTTMPPPSIPVHPNVMVQVVHSRHTHCAFNRPLADPAGNHRALHEAVEGWEASGARLGFYDYNPHSTFAQAPFSAGRKFHEDVKWLHQHGFTGYHSQSEGTLWGFYGLNHVSLARTLWNVDLDFDALQRDYFRCLYGHAAEPVQALHGAFEQALVEHEPMMTGLGTFLSQEVLARAKDLLREAGEAETSDAVLARLGVLAAQVEYGDRLMAARRTAETYNRTRDPADLKRLVRERDAILNYIEAHPVDGAYHLAGVRKGLHLYLSL